MRIATGPDMSIRWRTFAGTQTARCAGTTQAPASLCTLITPRDAKISCAQSWKCTGSFAPGG